MDSDEDRTARRVVLVVDDDAAVAVALKRVLTRLGYDVLVAGDGTDGFEQALEAKPAVILSDVNMPGMDGHALLKRLMRSGSQASVILMSGQGHLDDAIGALREGAVDYLKKPWTSEDLTAALDRAMELFGAVRDLTLPPKVVRSVALSGAARAGASVDASALIEELAARASPERLALPELLPVVVRLRREGAPDREWLDEVVNLVEHDPALSAAVFHMTSGAGEGQGEGQGEAPTTDLRALVASMKPETVYATVETLALRETFPIAVAPLRTLNDRICRFSVARALAMQGIADIAEDEAGLDRHRCYLAGLFLDAGASYLLWEIAEAMERSRAGISDVARMTAAVVAHHGHLGALVLQRWGLPSEVAELVRDHHTGPGPSLSLSPLRCVAALGGALAVRIAGFGDPTGDRDLRPELLARCAYTLGVGDTVLRRLMKSLTENANQLWVAWG